MKNHIITYIISLFILAGSTQQLAAQYISFKAQKAPDLSVYKKNYHGLVGINDRRALLGIHANDTVPRLYMLDYFGGEKKKGAIDFANYFSHSVAIEPPASIIQAVQRSGYTFILCKNKTVYVYDANARLLTHYEVLGAAKHSMDVNEAGTLLVSRNMKDIVLYDALTGQEVKQLIPEKPAELNSFQMRKVSFAPGGDYLMAADLFTLYYWDVHTGKQLGLFHVEGVGKSLVDFSLDAQAQQCVFSYYYEKAKRPKKFWGYKVFSLETGKVIREMEWEEARKPTGVSMDPTGSIFAITLEEENGFLFFATEKLKEDELLSASKGDLEKMAVSKNGRHSLPTKFHFHPTNPYVGYVTIQGSGRTTFNFCRLVYTGKQKDQEKVFGKIPRW